MWRVICVPMNWDPSATSRFWTRGVAVVTAQEVTERRLSEDQLIADWLAPLAGPAGLGLRDDAALLAPPAGCELVMTVDALVSGIHFFADDPPASIARKLVGVNLSDLAAKGADPLGFMLAMMLPDGLGNGWIKAFIDGLGEAAQQAAFPLIGGDTTRIEGPLALSLTAIGSVPAGKMVRRTTAGLGDVIAVTGTIGDAALGLLLQLPDPPAALMGLDAEQRGFLLDRYRHPRPRNSFAQALRAHASAAMDVSDGLVGDCRKLLRASDCGGVVCLDDVPLSDAVAAAVSVTPELLRHAVTGGDDYEILLCVPEQAFNTLSEEAVRLDLALHRIGTVTAGPEVMFTHQGGDMSFVHGSFQHF